VWRCVCESLGKIFDSCHASPNPIETVERDVHDFADCMKVNQSDALGLDRQFARPRGVQSSSDTQAK